jgi:DNA-binding LacI/PurR family transcriptional regulator
VAGTRAIGVLVSQIYSNYTMSIWDGISRGARARGYNVITYRGDFLHYDEARGLLPPNVVYDNIDFDQIDGFILVSTSIATAIPPEVYAGFCERFRSKPLVSIGDAPDFVPQCLIDNSSGFYNLVDHLIREHGCRSFAFLGGPKLAKEAITRYNAFRKALADNNLTFNEELLYHADFLNSRARVGIQALLAKKIKFDAVAAANDDMALSAAATLQELGYKIPEDVKIIGFDDIPNAMVAEPPLSTVRQPLYTQAFRTVNMLIDQVERKAVDKVEYIQTMPVIRKSCGCGQRDAAARKASIKFTAAYVFDKKNQEEIAGTITERMKHSLDAQSRAAIADLIGLFHQNLQEHGRSYLDKLQEILTSVTELNDIDTWQEITMNIEKRFAEFLSEDRFTAFTRLVDGQEKLINEKTMKVQSQKYALSNLENRNLREMLQGLGSSFQINDLHDFMAGNFKNRINIPSGYMVLFADESGASCRLIAGYDRNGKVDLTASAEAFPTKYLIPNGQHTLAEKPYFVCPITFDNKDIGVIILETGSAAAFIYESIASQLETSIRGSLLLKASTETANNMREWNRQIESEVKPMLETIRQVGDITDEKLKTIAVLTENSLASSKKISQTSDLIRGVSEKFTEMLEIISIIDGIATTVKIVSINASIEATHAGQFGRGFRVLAKEINKLSESTRQNAENIAETLRSVVDKIKISIEASQQSAASFREQEKSVSEILGAMMTITEYMKHLDAGSNKILAVMEKK